MSKRRKPAAPRPVLVQTSTPRLAWLQQPWIAPALFAFWFILALAFTWYGRYVGDEGWYCLVSREVWRGRSLYSDVPFTQMPLLPYVYGFFLKILPARIESARILSLLFTTSGIWAIWLTCRKRFGLGSANIALALVALNRAFPYHCTNVKTQGLGFALGCWCVYFCAKVNVRDLRFAVAAGLFAGLALLERLSMLPLALICPVFVYIATGRSLKAALANASTAWLLPMIVVTGFLLTNATSFLFGVYGFHILDNDPPALAVRFWHYWLNAGRDYCGANLLLLAGLVALLVYRSRERALEWFVAGTWIIIEALHSTRPATYPVYQTTVMWGPMLLAACACAVFPARTAGALVSVAFACVVFATPWTEGAMNLQTLRRPAGVYEVGRYIATLPGQKLFTMEAGFAFCAPEKQLIHGWEMSEFSLYWRPGAKTLDEKTATMRKYVTDLAEVADIATLRTMELQRILRPKVAEVTAQAWKDLYQPVKNFKYGQFNDTVVIGVRKPR